MKQTRILIVDDHPIVRQGLVDLINRYNHLVVCGEAGDVDAALDLVRTREFDLVIADLSLKGRSGLELIKQIHDLFPGLPVLVLSMHDESFYAERALRAGARGYVMKQEAIDRIDHAIRQVLKGELYVSANVASRMLQEFIVGETPGENTPVERLSNRELEVFQLLGQGFGTREIADILHLSIKTIESYRANIKNKMQLKNSGELVQQAVVWVQSTGIS